MSSELSAFVNEIKREDGDEEVVSGERPFLFVAPLGASVPEDGMFSYTTINDLRDLKGLEENSVVLFHEDQIHMLRTLCSNQAAFGLDVRALYGVSELDYRGWFDDASFGAERQMYGPMVAEIRIQRETEAIEAAARRTQTDIESARYTRDNGTVRHLDVRDPDDVTGSDDELE